MCSSHEMPISYAARLTAKWSANLFDGKEYVPSRDGQSGGVPVFECQYGTSTGKYAIKIEKLLTGQEFGWLGDSNVG